MWLHYKTNKGKDMMEHGISHELKFKKKCSVAMHEDTDITKCSTKRKEQYLGTRIESLLYLFLKSGEYYLISATTGHF